MSGSSANCDGPNGRWEELRRRFLKLRRQDPGSQLGHIGQLGHGSPEKPRNRFGSPEGIRTPDLFLERDKPWAPSDDAASDPVYRNLELWSADAVGSVPPELTRFSGAHSRRASTRLWGDKRVQHPEFASTRSHEVLSLAWHPRGRAAALDYAFIPLNRSASSPAVLRAVESRAGATRRAHVIRLKSREYVHG